MSNPTFHLEKTEKVRVFVTCKRRVLLSLLAASTGRDLQQLKPIATRRVRAVLGLFRLGPCGFAGSEKVSRTCCIWLEIKELGPGS